MDIFCTGYSFGSDTVLEKFDKFYKAEEYHQDYFKKNPRGYTCHRVREDWIF